MDDYQLEKMAHKISSDIQDVITDLINYAESLEGIIEDGRKKLEELEENSQQLADSLEDALYDLQQSELERLELIQLIKKFNNVDI